LFAAATAVRYGKTELMLCKKTKNPGAAIHLGCFVSARYIALFGNSKPKNLHKIFRLFDYDNV
jgi:hypothetical protein